MKDCTGEQGLAQNHPNHPAVSVGPSLSQGGQGTRSEDKHPGGERMQCSGERGVLLKKICAAQSKMLGD